MLQFLCPQFTVYALRISVHVGLLVVLPGGLFDDTEDATVESAFRYALLRINQDRTLLPDTRIVYDIQHLPAQNSFIAAKKGQHPGFRRSLMLHERCRNMDCVAFSHSSNATEIFSLRIISLSNFSRLSIFVCFN